MSLPDATSELATLVARAAHDRGGINPVLVDVTSKLALADAFVVVSTPWVAARSAAAARASAVSTSIGTAGQSPHRRSSA